MLVYAKIYCNVAFLYIYSVYYLSIIYFIYYLNIYIISEYIIYIIEYILYIRTLNMSYIYIKPFSFANRFISCLHFSALSKECCWNPKCCIGTLNNYPINRFIDTMHIICIYLFFR